MKLGGYPTLLATLSLLIAIEVLFAPHHDPVFSWHRVPGFQVLIGLVSCLVVVKLSKWLGRAGLQVPEPGGDD